MNKKGFTLAEILVALAISTMLIGSVLYVFEVTLKFNSANTTAQNLQRDADKVLRKITKGDIEAGVRLSEAVSCSITFNRYLDAINNPGNTYELHFIGTDGAERIFAAKDGSTVLYFHPLSEVIYTAPQGANLVLDFKPPWLGPLPPTWAQSLTGVSMYVTVTISQTVNGRLMSGSASTMVYLRNHST